MHSSMSFPHKSFNPNVISIHNTETDIIGEKETSEILE